MYVLVRKDLAETYRCVQGGHAVSQFALDNPERFRLWGNQTILYLGVRNENSLKLWIEKLNSKGKIWSGFYEPDLNNQLTAIACVDIGEVFKDLPMA
jgi:hypothetical protein